MRSSALTAVKLLPILSIMAMLTATVVAAEEKSVIGWIEKAELANKVIVLHAKIDTGAENSSLNAPDYNLFTRLNQPWVRFSIKNREGIRKEFELPVVRMVKIKRMGDPAQLRPVVKLNVCIADIRKVVEINLADRQQFDYQMLVGRSFLENSFIVDVSKQYTTEPRCSASKDM